MATCDDRYGDVQYEDYINDLHQEAVLDRAKREQCIFLLVEGESEEVAFDILLSDVLVEEGVQIGNYNGHGNLAAALRIINLTLSYDRPIIVTYDNDPSSIFSIEKCRTQGLLTPTVHPFTVPQEQVVEYFNGHWGGSFEESFGSSKFLDTVFSHDLLPASMIAQQTEIIRAFDSQKPWLKQLDKAAATPEHGYFKMKAIKVQLAEGLANACDALPPTYEALVDLIEGIRKAHPVIHPDDVEI